MEAIEFRSVPSAPEVMEFESTMEEEKYSEKKYLFLQKKYLFSKWKKYFSSKKVSALKN